MKERDLKEFQYLWTTELHDHLLLPVRDSDPVQYTIYHLPTKTVLSIDDNDLYDLVIEKMIKAGVKTAENLP